MDQREQQASAPLEYATPAPVPSPQSIVERAVTFGIISAVLGIMGPLTAWIFIKFHRGIPFSFMIGLALLIWGGANVTALVLGGVGWGTARRFRPNLGYLLCGCTNTLNWLGLGVLVVLVVVASG